MKIDEMLINLEGGIAAESDTRADLGSNGFCTLVLRDFGSRGWPYNQSLKLYMPYAFGAKAARIAAAINEIMAEPESRQFDDEGMFIIPTVNAAE